MSQAILLIDDDALLRRSLSYTLQRAGYSICTAGTADEGLEIARRERPDLVLLDIGLPGRDGLEALHLLRRDYHLPVILLTARRGEREESLGLTLGADDYVKKPYDTDVLLARIAAVLRRTRPSTRPPLDRAYCIGNLRIDPKARTVVAVSQPIDLTPRAFDLLAALASQPGIVVPLADLMKRVWGRDFEGESQVLYVHIRWLREKLASVPECRVRIVTVHRVGYKLVEEEGCSEPSAAG